MGLNFFDKNDQFCPEGYPLEDASKFFNLARSIRNNEGDFNGKLMILSVYTQDGELPRIKKNLFQSESFRNFEKPTKNNAKIFLFGVTESGASICVQVNNYQPWIRVQIPNDLSELEVAGICKEQKITNYEIEHLKCFYGYIPDEKTNEPKKERFLKCTFKTFQDCFRATKFFKVQNFQVTESAVKNGARFIHDKQCNMSEWIELKNYEMNDFGKFSSCFLECEVEYNDIVPFQSNAIAPMLVLSFDGEMFSFDKTFPHPTKNDMTIQIGMSFWIYGKPEIKHRVVLVVGECDQPENVHVFKFMNSKQLIEGFRDFIIASDPDIITGWNIYGFDFSFMHDDYMNNYLSMDEKSTEYYQSVILNNAYKYLKINEKFTFAADAYNQCKTKHFTLIDMSNKIAYRHLKHLNTKKEYDLFEVDENDSELSAEASYQIKKYLNVKIDSIKNYLQSVPRHILFKNVPQEIVDLYLRKQCEDEQRGLFLSRILSEKSNLTEKKMQSAAKGDNLYTFWNMTGRIIVDLMQIIKDDKKPESNALSFSADLYLENINKLDLKAEEIFDIYRRQDPSETMKIAEYCARDCDIPLLLIKKLTYIPIWTEMSRVCYTPINEIINSGQQVKVYNLLCRFIWNEYALNVRDSGWPIEENEDAEYQGATVIEPEVGFYNKCVSTLDFESLYPSIIRHFNLCPSVLVLDNYNIQTKNYKITHMIKNKPVDVEYKFASYPGVLPKLLKRLLDARKSVKKLMNETNDPLEKEILNGRQNGIKVACNSVYGFCGVGHDRGLLPCKPVAAVTTLMGRAFIETAKNIVEKNYDAKVIYGDTDSVMILWNGQIEISEAAELGKRAAKEITSFLQKSSNDNAVNLAYEKTYKPYLLMKKKNYVGLKWIEQNNVFKSSLDMKGIDAVRRDRPKLIRETSMILLNNLMYNGEVNVALKELTNILKSIANGERNIEDFILSKSLKNDYANQNVPHLMAWKRMKERGDEDVPPIGARMPFVVTIKNGNMGGKLYDRTEHPEYAKKNNLKIDTQYYLETLENPITKILQFVVDEKTLKKIFKDVYELSKHKLLRNSSLMQFMQKK